MQLVALVAAHFLAALAAPIVIRRAPRAGAFCLAAVPAAAAIYLTVRGLSSESAPLAVELSWAEAISLSLAMRLDALSLLFALLVTGIGAVVLVYAGTYMREGPRAGVFHGYLLAFGGAMLGLVLADDVISLYVFWELTSLFSFLLIGFNHEDKEARRAAWQAILVTVAGGLCLLASVVLASLVGGTTSLSELTANAEAVASSPWALGILVLALLAAFTKSAQFPFHFWLPNAMAAPTPVSAYLHSATMVNAGIYLLARLWPIFSDTTAWRIGVTTIGGITLLVTAAFAIVQVDMKRLLAYSTASALGMMCFLLGLGEAAAAQAALLFLLAHALYKGALFLYAGAVDHGTGTRRLDELRGLRGAMPWTSAGALLAFASMIGVPPTFGFVAKDAFLRASYDAPSDLLSSALLATLATVATSVYVGAALLVVVRPLFGDASPKVRTSHEVGWPLWASVGALALLGAALGPFTKPLGASLIEPATRALAGETPHEGPSLWHGFDLALGLSGVAIAAGIGLYVVAPILRRAAARGVPFKRFGPDAGYDALKDGVFALAKWQTRTLQHGFLPTYVLITVIAVAVLIGWPLLGFPEVAAVEQRPRVYELGLAVLVVIAALGAVFARSRLGTLASMSMVGFGVSLIFIDQRAPELGITQFLVETLFVVLFAFALPRLPTFRRRQRGRAALLHGVVAVFGGVVATSALLASLVRTPPRHVPEYYIANSHGQNIVNNVLVDFRALDTLGEITVLLVAAMGVTVLVRAARAERTEREQRGEGTP